MSVTVHSDFLRVAEGAEAKAGQILRKAANDILSNSHNRVPVLTGHLKSTGNVRAEGLHAEISYDADYAYWVEVGHMAPSMHSPNATHVPAQPYLRPAFDEVTPAMLAAFKELER